MSIIIKSGSSSATMDVDANGNGKVNLPTTDTQAGFVGVLAENDPGEVTGTRYMKACEVSEDYRLRVGVDQIQYLHSFEGTVVAQDRISQVVSTHTIAQASGFLTLNNGNSTATGHSVIRTYRTFGVYGPYTVYCSMNVAEVNPTTTGAVSEWGLGYATTNAAPTDGAFFRRPSGGANLQCVLVNNSNVINTVSVDATNLTARDGTAFDPTEANLYLIQWTANEVEFWVNDIRVASIDCATGLPTTAAACALPVFARVYATTPSDFRKLSVGLIAVEQADMNTGKPWPHVMAGSGGGSYQVQPGTASGGTVSRAAATNGYPASATAKTSGTWTATSAPANSELGGRWLSPAISTLTSDADYPVFAYLNPAGTATLPGKTLYVTGIRVGETIAMAAASTNGIMLIYAVGVGSTAAATSTGDAAATVAPRIGVLGSCYFTATAAIGETKAGWECNFNSPLVVPAGTYLHLIVRPVGTVASNTLTVHGSFLVNGYFE